MNWPMETAAACSSIWAMGDWYETFSVAHGLSPCGGGGNSPSSSSSW